MKLRLSLLAIIPILAGCSSVTETRNCSNLEWTVAAQLGDTTVTSSGLRFINTSTGSGPALGWCQTVRTSWALSLQSNGQLVEVENTRDHFAFIELTTGVAGFRLTAGLHQGLIGMQAGGTRRLIVPPELGYGAGFVTTSFGTAIPGGSTLFYDVEVHAVNP